MTLPDLFHQPLCDLSHISHFTIFVNYKHNFTVVFSQIFAYIISNRLGFFA